MKINYYSLVFLTGLLTVMAIAWIYFLGKWFHMPFWAFFILIGVVISVSLLLSRESKIE